MSVLFEKIHTNQIFVLKHSRYQHLCAISPRKNSSMHEYRKSRHRRASLTAEAALAFPLFFFTVFLLWQLFLLLLYEMQVGNAITKTIIQYSHLGYLERQSEEEIVDISWLYQPILWNSVPENKRVENRFVYCKETEKDWIEVKVYYNFCCEAPLFSKLCLPVVQTFCFYPYIGIYDGDKFAEGAASESAKDIVYVTEYGTVYHESKACGYLKVTVRGIPLSEVAMVRNNSGGKYYECERCDHLEQNATVYISAGGNRYHRGTNCAALKRTIKEVERSETTLSACHKCGKKENQE